MGEGIMTGKGHREHLLDAGYVLDLSGDYTDIG